MMKTWDVCELISKEADAYSEFLRVPAMSMGIYKLPAGGVDGQTPHTEDETYYVINGKALIEVDGETEVVRPGSIVYVPANAPHRFKAIEEDLTLLVFFAPAEKN